MIRCAVEGLYDKHISIDKSEIFRQINNQSKKHIEVEKKLKPSAHGSSANMLIDSYCDSGAGDGRICSFLCVCAYWNIGHSLHWIQKLKCMSVFSKENTVMYKKKFRGPFFWQINESFMLTHTHAHTTSIHHPRKLLNEVFIRVISRQAL